MSDEAQGAASTSTTPGASPRALAVGAGLGVLVFVAMALAQRDGPVLFDAAILRWFETVRADGLTDAVLGLTRLGGAKGMVVVTALCLAPLALRRDLRSAGFLLLAIAGAGGFNALIKLGFARPRPHFLSPLRFPTDLSFPSGHSMGSAAFGLAVFFVLAHLYPQRRRLAWLVLLWPLSMGATRLYMGVHYPTDVLGGWALGAASTLALAIWYRQQPA